MTSNGLHFFTAISRDFLKGTDLLDGRGQETIKGKNTELVGMRNCIPPLIYI